MSKVKHNLDPIRGFPEYSVSQQNAFNNMVEVIAKHYKNSGAHNIRTPLVERTEILSAKGGGAINKEIYGLTRLSESEDGSAASLGLRFDLTVPLARYVAQRESSLEFPFRRYQIEHVYRGDRPGKGRYREFVQADFDIIGRENLSILADAEPPIIINAIFSELNIGLYVIRINNRKILAGFFDHLQLDAKQQSEVLKIIDKQEGKEIQTINKLIKKVPCEHKVAQKIVEFLKLDVPIDNPSSVLENHKLNDVMAKGIDELCLVVAAILASGVPSSKLAIDLSVARGLDYYTGTIYETILLDFPDQGSPCSGGRYDDLTSSYSRSKFPGVGISIGVSRLFDVLEPAEDISYPDNVLVANLDPDLTNEYLRITGELRLANIATEFYSEQKTLGSQLKYALSKGYGYVVIVGPEEFSKKQVLIKELNTGHQCEVSEMDLISYMKSKILV